MGRFSNGQGNAENARGWAVLVTDRQLLPTLSGNRLRILGVIRALRALGWKVVLIGANLGPSEELKRLVDALVVVNARGFIGGELRSFDARPFRRAVERVVARLRPAVVIAEYAWMAPALATLPKGVRRWVDCHDMLHERCERFSAAGLDPWTICDREEEAGLLGCADVLITCQQRDAQVLQELLPRKRVVCMFTQIDLPAGFARSSAGGATVLAVGANHPGNEGICEFAQQVWSDVLVRVPQARLEIVGAIGANLPALRGVDAVGQVVDLHKHYESAAVVVCPVTVGSGVKTKMLEALRLGKAVVVTTAAEEGLPRPARPAWITTDSLPLCADAVVRLLMDRTSRTVLEDAAFAFGEQHVSAEKFQDDIRSLLPKGVLPNSAQASDRSGLLDADSRAATRSAGVERDDNCVVQKRKDISVVVRQAGSDRQLRNCLRSLRTQSYPHTGFEIIIVENSNQPTPQVVRQSPTVIVTGSTNLSAAGARNQGAAIAKGDIIAFLDSDCFPHRDWLRNAVAVVGPHGEDCIVVSHTKPGRKPSGVSAIEWYQAVAFGEQQATAERLKRSTSGIFVPQAIWRLVGPFDEDAEGFADGDWAARAISRRAHIVYAPDAVIVHPVEATRHGLRRKTRAAVQSELRLLMNSGKKDQAEFWPRVVAGTKQLKRNLFATMLKRAVPWRFRLGVTVTAGLVWYWSLSETRKGLRANGTRDNGGRKLSSEPGLDAASLAMRSVSVIVPCAGWPDTLSACVESLRAQVVDLPVEIVLVINGPNADAADQVFTGVTIVHEPKQGPAAARNAGVRASTGDVLAFIDSDCVASRNWLASAVTTMRDGAAASIVAGAITRSGARQNWVSFYDSVTYLQQEKYVKGSRNCVTANLIVHRSVFDLVGPFDETFNEAAFEDWDWTMRAGLVGIPVIYAPRTIIDHPCMSRPEELKRKAERLARGKLLMQRKSGSSNEPPRLLGTLRALLRSAYRNKRVSPTDRMRLMCVACAVGFWQWNAGRLAHRQTEG